MSSVFLECFFPKIFEEVSFLVMGGTDDLTSAKPKTNHWAGGPNSPYSQYCPPL